MPPTPVLMFAAALLAVAPGALQAAAEKTDPASAQAWNDAAIGLFKEAHSSFADAGDEDSRLGAALTLLLQQPKTASNIDRAAAQLRDLAAAAPDSESGIAARYYLGRVEQAHRFTPDPEAARGHYRTLIADHPAHPLAEQAVVKLAILDIYEPVAADVRKTRFDSYLARVGSLATASARRDLAILLADAGMRFGYPASVSLDCLLVADQAGVARRVEQANIWVRIGQLAAETGRPDTARDYYERFLATFTRDNRRRMIAERLAALSAPAAPTASAR